MPCDYATYHPDWHWISRQIREQADNRCEWCGVENKAVGARDRAGEWHAVDDINGMSCSGGVALFGPEFPRIIQIVLTVAHLDHDKGNNDPANLRALCQRCHLNWDRELHQARAAVTRQASKQRASEEARRVRGQLAFGEASL